MASDNAPAGDAQEPDPASDNTRVRRGRAPAALPAGLEGEHRAYAEALGAATVLAERTRRAYASRVRQYLAWVGSGLADGDPLGDPGARDGAVRDWRAHLQTEAKAPASTVNLSLAAVCDFYARTGRGRVAAERMDAPRRAPLALDARDGLRWLRAVERVSSTRDRLICLIPFYAGLRISEVVALDVDDVRLSARKGVIEVRSGKGRRARTVPAHRALREELRLWLHDGERETWNPAGAALLPNASGARLGARGMHDVLVNLAAEARLEHVSAHVLRHTFATNLIRWGVDVVTVADLMGHARLDTTRDYTRPSADDLDRAVQTLPYDK